MKLDEIRKILPGLEKAATPQQRLQMLAQLRAKGDLPSFSYQELEMSSPLADTHRDVSFSNAKVQLHSHNFYEILCCTNTCGAEYLLGAERYRLQKGDILFVCPGVSHRPILPEGMAQPYVRDVLWLSTEFMQMMSCVEPEWREPEQEKTNLLRTSGTHWEFLPEWISAGVQEYEAQTPGWQTMVVGNAMQVLTHLRRAFQDQSAPLTKAERPQLLEQVLAYVEEHLSEKIRLPEVAQHFYVSTSTISHEFSRKMGVSFYRCVTQRRLIAAKERIAKGELLETIGEQVGFSDYSAFYRAFKAEYGISPRQYRKMQMP